MSMQRYHLYQQTSLAILFLLFACPRSASAVETREVISRITKIAKEHSESYEILLATASPVAQKAFRGASWPEVEKNLKSAGLKPLDPSGGAGEHRYELLTGAIKIKPGVEMTLYLAFDVSGGRSQPTYEIPETYTVTEATVGLCATTLVELETARNENWFGAKSILQDALADWPLNDAIKKFPLLGTVDITLATSGADDSGGPISTYQLRLELARSKPERQNRLLLKCQAGCGKQVGDPHGPIVFWRSREEWSAPAKLTVVEDLRRLAKENPKSCQVLLFQATHLAKKAIANREWSDICKQLKEQNLSDRERATDSESPVNHRYVVAEKAFTTNQGQSMDLFLEVETIRRTSKDEATHEVICGVRAGLHASVKLDYAKVISQQQFGKGTAIHQALLEPEAKRYAEKYGMLGAVDVYYDVIGDRWSGFDAWGFDIQLYFEAADKQSGGSACQYAYAISDLDPPSAAGFKLLIRDFTAHDTLSRVFCSGSSENPPRAITPTSREFYFLTKKGASRWRKSADDEPEPTAAYSPGDLKTLSNKTTAIAVKNNEIYDDDLAVISRFTELTALDVSRCPGISDRGLAHLAGLKKLQSLRLSGERVVGRGFKHFRQMPDLTEISLDSTVRLSGEGIAELTKFKSLKKLTLAWDENLSDEQLAQLAGLTALRELNLWAASNITDAGLEQVAKLSNLESLTFSHAKKITPAGIDHLIRLKNLREVKFGYMPWSDAELKSLAQLPTLEYVEFHGLAVSDTGLQSLGKLGNLQRLYLERCSGVTSDGVGKLQAALHGEYVLDPD